MFYGNKLTRTHNYRHNNSPNGIFNVMWTIHTYILWLCGIGGYTLLQIQTEKCDTSAKKKEKKNIFIPLQIPTSSLKIYQRWKITKNYYINKLYMKTILNIIENLFQHTNWWNIIPHCCYYIFIINIHQTNCHW